MHKENKPNVYVVVSDCSRSRSDSLQLTRSWPLTWIRWPDGGGQTDTSDWPTLMRRQARYDLRAEEKQTLSKLGPKHPCLRHGCAHARHEHPHTNTRAFTLVTAACEWQTRRDADVEGDTCTHTWKKRADCVNKLCRSYCIPSIIFDVHVFPHSLSQRTVSMPEWRVCEKGNEWGRKLCWIQYTRFIQIHSKPFRTPARINTPDGSRCVKKTFFAHMDGETTHYQSA